MSTFDIGAFLTEGKEIPQGSALTATQTQTVLPQWYTDYAKQLLANQQAVMQTPFQTAPMPRVAEFSPAQQQAFNLTGQAATSYQPLLGVAAANALTSGNQSTVAAAQPFVDTALSISQAPAVGLINQATGTSALDATQPFLEKAFEVKVGDYVQKLSGISSDGAGAASPYFDKALAFDPAAAAQGDFNTARSFASQAGALNTLDTAAPLINQAAGLNGYDTARPYLTQAAQLNGFDIASPFLNQAANINGAEVARPYLDRAANLSAMDVASPYFGQALGTANASMTPLGMAAAAPFLQMAGQRVTDVSDYMNPYSEQVAQRAAELGARALREQLLPQIEGRYIGAGQLGFGNTAGVGTPSGMMTDTVRALRDVDDNVRAQQAAILERGYAQAQQTAQADLARFGQLAGTAGQLGSDQQRAMLAAAGLQSDVARSFGELTGQQQAALANIGSVAGNLTQGQQRALADIGGVAGELTQGQQGALANIGSVAGNLTQGQQRSLADLASTVGGLTAQQQQSLLAAATNATQLGRAGSDIALGQANLAADIGGRVGQLTGEDAARAIQSAQAAAGLALEQQQAYIDAAIKMGQLSDMDSDTKIAAAGTLGNLTQGQQELLLSAGNQLGDFTNADNASSRAFTSQLADLAALNQQLGLTGAGALNTIGTQQQTQAQANLDAAYADFLRQQGYPQDQINNALKTFQGVGNAAAPGSQTVGLVPNNQPVGPGTAATIGGALTGLGGLIELLRGG